MDTAIIKRRFLESYDSQLRTQSEVHSATTVRRLGPLWLAVFGTSSGFVTYESLGGLDRNGIHDLVGEASKWFERNQDIQEVEWKTRAHDEAPGLEQALRDYGFVPQPTESIMVGEAKKLAVDVPLPENVVLRQITSQSDVLNMARMEAQIFSLDSYVDRVPQMMRELAQGTGMELWVAEAIDKAGIRHMVSAGRLEPVAGTDFAGLWGDGTLPQWRRKGIYRALTAARARSAIAQGKILLNADCTEMSRPILERSGLIKISQTTPWIWTRKSDVVASQ